MTAPMDHGQPARKPRVALMGEFSAGKSTLSNVLLGEAPFPVKVTATRLPPVWASHGESAAFVVDHDGTETPLDLDDLDSVSLDETALIRLQRQTEILELCDLIDMPGVSDPNMPADVWLRMIEEVDFVIWLTHANQAWRQSEAAIWERIVNETNGQNLLLVTQIDKIRSERDRDRVMARVHKETDGLFAGVYPVSLLKVAEAGDDFDISQESGTAAFIEHLVEILLNPAATGPKNGIAWDTAPELPRGDNAKATRDVTIAAEDSVNSAMEDDDSADTAELQTVAEAAVIPKRVRPPENRRTRPPRSEAAHG